MACGCVLPMTNPNACCNCPNNGWMSRAYGPINIMPSVPVIDYKKLADLLADRLKGVEQKP